MVEVLGSSRLQICIATGLLLVCLRDPYNELVDPVVQGKNLTWIRVTRLIIRTCMQTRVDITHSKH